MKEIQKTEETDKVQRQEGDYADLVTYLTGLFGIKKVPQIGLDQYIIKYKSTIVLRGMSGDSEYETSDFPEKSERESAKTLNLEVTGIHPEVAYDVSINWVWVKFQPDVDEKEANAFIDRLDMSTFRYF